MRVREATDSSSKLPIRESAQHSLPPTQSSIPRSESVAHPSVTSVAELEVSHCTLSDSATTDGQPPLHVTGEKSARSPYGQRNDSRNQQHVHGTPRVRRDSFHGDPSSPRHNYVLSSGRDARDDKIIYSKSRDFRSLLDSIGNERRPSFGKVTHSGFPYTLDVQTEDDAVGGAEVAHIGTRDQRISRPSTLSSSTQSFDSARPYSSILGTLGIPRGLIPRNGLSPRHSIEVISDAGDQQQQHQERHSVQADGFSREEYDLAQSLASLPPFGSRHELQTKILNARQCTRNNEGQVRRFIPKEALCRVIDLASVAQELRKVLPHLSAEEISSYSKAVCQQTETNTKRHGKYQIKSFRKIFALLVLLEAASSIIKFLEEDVSDQDLPLKLVELRGTLVFHRKGVHTKTALQCFSHEVWSPVRLESFQEYQWLLLAPFFSPVENGIVKHYVLQTQHILPFVASDTADDNVADKLGGYGKVLMVHIHPDHHNFQDSKLSERGFAVKQQIDDEDREAFKQEAEILRKFSGENAHPHVVSLLATYEQFNKFHLVFYRAEGDLLDYWRKFRPRPHLSYNNIMWMAQQCAGLADGLSRLHKILSFKNQKICAQRPVVEDTVETVFTSAKHAGKHVKIILPLQNRVGTDSSIQSNGVQERTTSPIRPSYAYDQDGLSHHQEQFDEDLHRKQFGRHGDIHPKNILWYSDGDDIKTERSDDQSALSGTLVIADFGQAEVNSFFTKTKRRDVANTLTYRPPECDVQPTCIRQSYDIWCLGCVYLEFVTWLLGGRQLLHKFSKDRLTPDIIQGGNNSDTFFEVFKNQEGADAFMVKPAVTKFFDQLHQHRDCTDYLHRLLIIIQHDMLVVDSAKRKSCAAIRDRLHDMHYECRRDIDYATAPSPWCISRPPIPCAVELEMPAYAQRVIEEDLDPQSTDSAVQLQDAMPNRVRPSRIPRRKKQ